ncbi:MAG: adenylate kinase family protein [Candidatus Thermoplasmatota archaeon]
MKIAITGTPGTGKTSVAKKLGNEGYKVVHLNQMAIKNFLDGEDKKRDSKIINIDKLNSFLEEKFKDVDDYIFFESHLSHLLNCVDKIIVLRCHPMSLKKRLESKQWKKQKVKENLEAEIIDIVLCETLEVHSQSDVFEIDTTSINIDDVSSVIKKLVEKDFKSNKGYEVGKVDWSEEILKNF